jgi:hypothetical protein
MPTAAEALWPHLSNRPAPSPSPQPRPSALAASMYPRLTAKPPPKVRTALNKIGRPQAAHFGAGYVQQSNKYKA